MPNETHTYRDRDGNPCAMSEAWSTVVTRESEWNKYAQDSAIALGLYESRRCPSCHNWDALVPVNSVKRQVPSADGTVRHVEVASLRCAFCGVADGVKRDAVMAHKDVEPVRGEPFWADGLMYAARPPTEEVN